MFVLPTFHGHVIRIKAIYSRVYNRKDDGELLETDYYVFTTLFPVSFDDLRMGRTVCRVDVVVTSQGESMTTRTLSNDVRYINVV